MKRCVPVAVCHVDHKLQQLRGDGGKGTHIGLDNSCVRCFVTGHAQPLLQHSGVGGPLRSDTMSTIRETYNKIKVEVTMLRLSKSINKDLLEIKPLEKDRTYFL